MGVNLADLYSGIELLDQLYFSGLPSLVLTGSPRGAYFWLPCLWPALVAGHLCRSSQWQPKLMARARTARMTTSMRMRPSWTTSTALAISTNLRAATSG
jgi:hypothetical protein